ncbi:acyltransferase [bacterium]|nr:acyltransferase [candidate division CSSED10-310 bacterium]
MSGLNADSERSRLNFLDALTGFAILRVVFIHAVSDYSAVVWNMPPYFHNFPVWAQIMDICLRFNVPVFVLLAGYKYQLSIERHPDRSYPAYCLSRILRLAVPFLIWTWIYYLGKGLLFPEVLQQDPLYRHFPVPDFGRIATMLSGARHPGFQLWFIPMLITVNIAYPPIRRLLRHPWTLLVLTAGVFGISIRLNLKMPFSYIEYLLLYHLGSMFSESTHIRNRTLQTGWIRVSAIVALPLLIFIKFIRPADSLADKGLMLSVPVVLFTLFNLLNNRPLLNIFKWIGRRTWQIYILHEPLLLFPIMKWTALSAGIRSAWAIPLSGTAAILICLFLLEIFRKMNIHRVLF